MAKIGQKIGPNKANMNVELDSKSLIFPKSERKCGNERRKTRQASKAPQKQGF